MNTINEVIMKFLKKIYHLFIKRDVVLSSYKWNFKKFGKNSTLYSPRCIRGKKYISIGNNTTILNDVRMQVYNDITKKASNIIIGNNCYIGYNNSFLAGGNIIVEDGVLLASNILITSENHSIDPESSVYYMNQSLLCNDIRICEGTWIGERACILPGVTIGKKCVIGAGSIVTKSIPDFSIAIGSPARVIKTYNFELHKWVKADK